MQTSFCQKDGWETLHSKQTKGLVSTHIATAHENVSGKSKFYTASVSQRNGLTMSNSVAPAVTRVILARYVYNFDMELVSPEKGLTDGSTVRLVWSHAPLMVRIRPAAPLHA